MTILADGGPGDRLAGAEESGADALGGGGGRAVALSALQAVRACLYRSKGLLASPCITSASIAYVSASNEIPAARIDAALSVPVTVVTARMDPAAGEPCPTEHGEQHDKANYKQDIADHRSSLPPMGAEAYTAIG